MSKKILVTGAAGTVGETAGRYLKEKGHDVIGVGLNECDENCYTQIHSIDLTERKNVEELDDLLEGAEAVLHLSWNLSEENFDTNSTWEGNMDMFRNVLEAAKDKVDIFVNGSSIHAGTGDISAYTAEASLKNTPEPYRSSIDPLDSYDMRKEDPQKLLDPREDNPDSPYGESKVETERLLREAVEKGRFKLGVSIRIGGVNSEDESELEDEPYYRSLYWSHRDVGRAIENILIADLNEKKGYHQFYGVSDNEGRIFSIENAFIGGGKSNSSKRGL